MRRNIAVYLDDILESIRRIEVSTRNISQAAFESDVDTQDAVVRRIEIVGEAIKHIPQEFRDTHPQVPWRKVAGTRDVIIHNYFDVNLGGIWNIIQNDLAPLKQQVIDILAEFDGEQTTPPQ
ncbi:MAG: HepT-like ribonuclease domain-containing protein [Chloroflexota bacterium]